MTFDLERWQECALEIIISEAQLTARPSALNRARARIHDVANAQSATLELLASTLREVGVIATVERINAASANFVFPLDVILEVDGRPVRKTLTNEHEITELIQRHPDTGLTFVLIAGRGSSFLSSDASMPRHRGHDLHESDPGRSTLPPDAYLRRVWPAFKRILRGERRDIWIVLVYSVLSSLLGLAVPLSSQAIVNAVALGVFSQQLVVLCAVVFVATIAIAVIAVFERYVIDMIQRRVFVNTAFDIVYRIPHITQGAMRRNYAPELVNRFFDVMTVQKSLGKFLLEGVNAALVLLTGLVVLGFYHPFFLLYDLLFLLFIPLLVYVLGRGALYTSVKVSKLKYVTAAWLEDVARNQMGLKITNTSSYTFSNLNEIATGYVEAKHLQYRVIARQILGSYIFKGSATVGVLALGGILVIDQSISLGQLVAAELIIILILGAMEKLINQFDLFYDLVAAIDKLSVITDQPLEDVGGVEVPRTGSGASVEVRDLSFTYDSSTVLSNVSLSIAPGERVSLVGQSGAGKSTLAHLILGLHMPSAGCILVNGVDTRVADLKSLRTRVGYVFPENQIMPGTVLANITLGRRFSNADIDWALSTAGLKQAVSELPLGLHTMISSTGEEFSYGMRRRILFARMIVARPQFLIIDEAFEGIEDNMKLEIFDAIMAYKGWTVLNISHDPEVVHRTDLVHVLHNGVICQSGSPAELQDCDGTFTQLFPGGNNG